jgi:hypothetical protein
MGVLLFNPWTDRFRWNPASRDYLDAGYGRLFFESLVWGGEVVQG